ncbi:hypothetical protein Tsubulata_047412 [Turnera subulata]|uniref:CMP/dCMP-type deaminase domain-containing protein n=1 Tax=Turnera subulata TaxID=218843 RepID=A0A9Q0J5N7_9ROSI|nr:hypothetical protein Tsubulata_047412 [Turnera subulata]
MNHISTTRSTPTAVLALPDVEVAVEQVIAQPRRGDLWFAGETMQTFWCSCALRDGGWHRTPNSVAAHGSSDPISLRHMERQLLPTLAKSAQTLARPPISNYHVGAVGLGSSGRIFFGSNLEFPSLPLHQSVYVE